MCGTDKSNREKRTVFQSKICRLECSPVLRVHARCIFRGDGEEGRVKDAEVFFDKVSASQRNLVGADVGVSDSHLQVSHSTTCSPEQVRKYDDIDLNLPSLGDFHRGGKMRRCSGGPGGTQCSRTCLGISSARRTPPRLLPGGTRTPRPLWRWAPASGPPKRDVPFLLAMTSGCLPRVGRVSDADSIFKARSLTVGMYPTRPTLNLGGQGGWKLSAAAYIRSISIYIPKRTEP